MERFAGFWRRSGAHLVDTVVVNGLAWLVSLLIFWSVYSVWMVLAWRSGTTLKPFSDAFDPFVSQVVDALIFLVFAAVYFVWGQFRYSTTFGKKLFKIYVVNEADGAPMSLKQSTLRFIGYLPSYLLLGCGFLMVAFHPKKRALHDLIAGTVSVVRGVAVVFLLLASAASVQAAESPAIQGSASFVSVRPSALGAELGFAALIQPASDFAFFVGPRVSALWAQGDSRTRWDLNTGVEGTLWFVNAIGAGLALDLVAPTSLTGEDLPIHYRAVPQVSVRFAHFGETGAWAFRVGVPYDTHFKWGIQAGVVLQFNQVPTLGNKAAL